MTSEARDIVDSLQDLADNFQGDPHHYVKAIPDIARKGAEEIRRLREALEKIAAGNPGPILSHVDARHVARQALSPTGD